MTLYIIAIVNAGIIHDEYAHTHTVDLLFGDFLLCQGSVEGSE
jgi:hypothetical protein